MTNQSDEFTLLEEYIDDIVDGIVNDTGYNSEKNESNNYDDSMMIIIGSITRLHSLSLNMKNKPCLKHLSYHYNIIDIPTRGGTLVLKFADFWVI